MFLQSPCIQVEAEFCPFSASPIICFVICRAIKRRKNSRYNTVERNQASTQRIKFHRRGISGRGTRISGQRGPRSLNIPEVIRNFVISQPGWLIFRCNRSVATFTVPPFFVSFRGYDTARARCTCGNVAFVNSGVHASSMIDARNRAALSVLNESSR